MPFLAMIQPPWHFPVFLNVLGLHVPIHPVCDALAYLAGFRLYLFLRRRSPGEPLSWDVHGWILAGCIFGAIAGAKLLAWMEAPAFYWAMRHDPHFWFGGKTIVGGLLGGWAGVEIAKKALGVAGTMGDAAVYPLIAGMCIGRIGCFLTGLSDNTCGVRTNLPWGVDYGDGIPRHPAQIYEILFLLALGLVLTMERKHLARPGLQFRWFIAGYLAFRLVVDFIKPHWTLFAGLSGIQWGCVAGLFVCAYSIMNFIETPEASHV
jgi:prolipoprotein diacylglyceryltransferase